MRAKHCTSDPLYRQPFGAAPLGGEITLGIDVWDVQHPSAKVRLWVDDDGETLLDMEGQREGDHVHFSASFTPKQTEIIWYSFQITADDGAIWRYGARPECRVGEGAFAYGDPDSFQITVYEPREVKPEWYRNGVVYQIFPDRFNRGKDWERRVRDALEGERKGPERDLVADWDTVPHYRKDNYGRISVWDFYGGTLEGIREKLDYLAALGITVIYLNPIFEAASNHRYDTADYLKIDPMLGDEESFKRLCADANALGIKIILDGVFNHTGCDSRYFNKYGNYPTLGAYQSDKSPYASWYKFSDEDRHNYQSWWGVDDLPDVEEEDPGYREFICGKNGVVRKWLRLGASGWRLDVADELPDDFIVAIKEAALAEKPDAVLIGEVWEDASNKRSYGVLRKYLQGKELDDVDQHGAGSSAACHQKRLAHHVGQLADVADHVVPLRDGHRDAGDVHLLERVLAQQVLADVARDGHDGRAVHVGGRDARGEVRAARARGGEAHADLAGGACVAVGGVRRALLVAHQVVVDLGGLVQGVVHIQDGAAGIAEHGVDALLLQALQQDLCSGEFHGLGPPFLVVCRLCFRAACRPRLAGAVQRNAGRTGGGGLAEVLVALRAPRVCADRAI